eukprot:CAMPEP_0175871116 /NCGR_PEP_ID=MMETSP0107_2-20121207/36951_1 /TAXON_ID=195067 ORGANISM="Goniomonas pacifica, Strain CCMP1869" /NCGR_SAMPLE_ID=MMETSP0107_2 /ASSEMBLY_ACC=CAM_ASM_000203 /LENGTH=97 /DNA_ID=CAMNT_0017189449 /DNA_START=12 /DNA_END=301 /DNA_ORIENTATION=-
MDESVRTLHHSLDAQTRDGLEWRRQALEAQTLAEQHHVQLKMGSQYIDRTCLALRQREAQRARELMQLLDELSARRRVHGAMSPTFLDKITELITLL